MLKAFMDESGDSVDPFCKFVGMGGVIADTDKWASFEVAWRAALDEFIGGHPFHMKEFVCVPGIGVYKGWEEPQRKALLGRLVRAILDNGIQFVGCVVSIQDFGRLHAEHKSIFLDPYYMAFQSVTRGMAIIAHSEHLFLDRPEEPVALVYALQEKFGATEAGRAQQLWHAMQTNTDLGKWMGMYSSGDPKKVLGLQAADLFAYELTQEFEHFFEEPRRKMRWAMKQFVLSMKEHILVKFYAMPVIVQTLVENKHLTGTDDEKMNLQMESDGFQSKVREVLIWRSKER
jgi:hypothetical protein